MSVSDNHTSNCGAVMWTWTEEETECPRVEMVQRDKLLFTTSMASDVTSPSVARRKREWTR